MTKFPFSPHVRSDRAVISIGGEGGLAFLQNLLTCDLNHLPYGAGAYGALLSPQGKILHDVFVLKGEDTVVIDCALEQRAALFQKLQLYKLRAKLDIKMRDDLEVVVGDAGYIDPRNSGMGYRLFSVKGQFSKGDGYDKQRIALGLADSIEDIGSNVLFPHEANFDRFEGVSFSKGCYVGQEVVSRMEHRGTTKTRIMRVKCEGLAPAKGSEIRSGAILMGEILSSVHENALALIRVDRLAEVDLPLMSGAIALQVIS